MSPFDISTDSHPTHVQQVAELSTTHCHCLVLCESAIPSLVLYWKLSTIFALVVCLLPVADKVYTCHYKTFKS